MTDFTATYSPDDDKLRLYASKRLNDETYARVRAAGFIWVPKQDLFVAPTWTPDREDLLAELAGEIGDEDASLLDRARERADRFADYGDKRAADAVQAHNVVTTLADGIPLGQPILVGHPSERRVRRDAERIEAGMRRAVKAFETAQYWQERAAGAIRNARYKERPDLRARRIRKLEAAKRKAEREKTEAERWIRVWGKVHLAGVMSNKVGTPSIFLERVAYLTEHGFGCAYGVYLDLVQNKTTPEAVQADVLASQRRVLAHCDRWLSHYNNRPTYERAMLAADGGTVAAEAEADVAVHVARVASPATCELCGGRVGLVRQPGRVEVRCAACALLPLPNEA